LSFGVTFADANITGVMESTYTMNGVNKGMGNGMNGGSEFRLGGTEDLGNGMKADFSYAFVQNHNTGSALANYNSYVGLSGEFGSLKIGKLFTPLALATWGNSAMAGTAIDTNLANGSGVQPSGTVTYTSPNISGFSLSAQGNNQTTTYSDTKSITGSTTIKKSSGYSLSFATGGLSASYASNTIDGDKAINGLGASYDFGMAKVFVSSLTQSGAKDATGFGISVPVGAATLIASSSSQGTADNYELVAKYNFSKRTLVYFQNTNKDTGAVNTSAVSTNSIGISHAF